MNVSVRSITRILQLMVAQKLLERDHKTSVTSYKDIFENVPANALLITVPGTKLTSIYLILSTIIIFATDQKAILERYIKGLFAVNK